MKLRKISLRRGLKRIIEPSFAMPKLSRWKYKNQTPYTLTPQQELHKYSVKPGYNSFPWFISIFLGSFSAICWMVYERELNKNELDTIYRYRYHQEQLGSTKLYLRMLILKMMLYFQENYYVSAFFKKNKLGGFEMEYYTEALIRYRQYKNFQQKKDRKFDFLELGVLEKFPYPKRTAQQGME